MFRPILSLLLALAAVVPQSLAQDLHIHYDAHRDSLYFLQNGQPIARPMVRKGNEVILHVSNYNNYLYNIEVKKPMATEAPAQRSAAGFLSDAMGGNFNPLQLLLGASSPLSGVSSLLKGMSGNLSNDDESHESGFAFAQPATDRTDVVQQERLAELKRHTAQFESFWQNAEKRAQEISKVQKEMEAHLQIIQIQAFAAEELERIRHIQQIEPRQIRQLSQRYMQSIFGHADPAQLGIGEIMEAANVGATLQMDQQRYASLIAQYAEDAGVVKLAGEVFSDPKFEFSGSNIFQLRSVTDKAVKTTITNLETYKSNLQAVAAALPDAAGLNAQQLAKIQTEYLILMENDFSKTFRHTADEDDMLLQMVFSPLDSAAATVVAEKSLEPLKINVYGGLQIRPAIGLGFGGFFQQPLNYFVRDSLILSSNRDAVTPYLSSFIHFYPKSRRETSLGGSIGVGVPISGNENAGLFDAISFFVGPSLVLGRNQSVVLSLSLMGGKVNRLAEGFTTGDYFEGPTELLRTESVYRLGYALGVSFNLGSF